MSQSAKIDTVITLASASALAEGVIMRVSGNAVSNRIAGDTLTPALLQSIIAAKFKKKFVPVVSGA